MTHWLKSPELQGETVTLIPLLPNHAADLVRAASDGELWDLWYTHVPCHEDVDAYIETALHGQSMGLALPYAVLERQSGKIIGTTRYCNADPVNRRVEIGFTFYAQRFHGTCINTECKYLLLKHAFTQLDAIAVELRTHWHNKRSQAAISKLGAKQDGVLRNHRIDDNGIIRDTVVYSILRDEWLSVKQALEFRLRAKR